MRKVIVIDCSGSMAGDPMDRMIRHIETHHDPRDAWLTVIGRRLEMGIVRDIRRIERLPLNGSEIIDGLRAAFAPGTHVVLYTDDCEDFQEIEETSNGHDLDIYVIRTGGGDVRPRIQGRVTFI